MPESGINRMRKIAEVEYNPDLWRNKQELINKIIDADALVVRNQTIVDQEILEAGKKLKVIGRLGVGLDNINLLAAKQCKNRLRQKCQFGFSSRICYGRYFNGIEAYHTSRRRR